MQAPLYTEGRRDTAGKPAIHERIHPPAAELRTCDRNRALISATTSSTLLCSFAIARSYNCSNRAESAALPRRSSICPGGCVFLARRRSLIVSREAERSEEHTSELQS